MRSDSLLRRRNRRPQSNTARTSPYSTRAPGIRAFGRYYLPGGEQARRISKTDVVSSRWRFRLGRARESGARPRSASAPGRSPLPRTTRRTSTRGRTASAFPSGRATSRLSSPRARLERRRARASSCERGRVGRTCAKRRRLASSASKGRRLASSVSKKRRLASSDFGREIPRRKGDVSRRPTDFGREIPHRLAPPRAGRRRGPSQKERPPERELVVVPAPARPPVHQQLPAPVRVAHEIDAAVGDYRRPDVAGRDEGRLGRQLQVKARVHVVPAGSRPRSARRALIWLSTRPSPRTIRAGAAASPAAEGGSRPRRGVPRGYSEGGSPRTRPNRRTRTRASAVRSKDRTKAVPLGRALRGHGVQVGVERRVARAQARRARLQQKRPQRGHRLGHVH